MTNWQLYFWDGEYTLSGVADKHPTLGKNACVSKTSSIIDFVYKDDILTCKTENTVYVCPLKYMEISPYKRMPIECKEKLLHQVNESMSVLNKIVIATAKLSLENNRDNGPEFWDKEYKLDLDNVDFSDDELLNRIKYLQKVGQKEITEMEEAENKRLIEIVKKYEDCIYIEVSNVCDGNKLAYHLGECVGIVEASVHRGMFQDSVLYLKYPCEEDKCSLDFRYFPRCCGMAMETYSWSDNIKQAVIMNDDEYALKFNNINILCGETKVFTPDMHRQGLISPDCYNGKSVFTTSEPDDK